MPWRSVPTTPVPPSPRVIGDAPVGEPGRDQVGGAVFLEAQLGMGVDVAADLLDFGAELDDSVDQLHGAPRVGTVDRY